MGVFCKGENSSKRHTQQTMQLLPLQQLGWKAAGAKQQPLPPPCPPLPRAAPICLLPRTSTSAHTPACSASTSGSSTFSSSSSTGLNHPQQRRAHRGRRLRAAAEGTEAAGPASTKLADLQASPLVNEQVRAWMVRCASAGVKRRRADVWAGR